MNVIALCIICFTFVYIKNGKSHEKINSRFQNLFQQYGSILY
jgi:hypothetical protein